MKNNQLFLLPEGKKQHKFLQRKIETEIKKKEAREARQLQLLNKKKYIHNPNEIQLNLLD